MKPKEKALRICQAFGRTTLFAEDCNEGRTLPLRIAKLCAAILVDEIINEFPQGYNGNFEEKRKQYWQEVKEEIIVL